LARQPEIYFEAGDHQLLAKMTGEQFRRLMANAIEGHFSHHL
jgi:Ala-tRNA(Pro) deacylase